MLGIYAAFHILNHFVFNIGIFPWMTLFASLLCFLNQRPSTRGYSKPLWAPSHKGAPLVCLQPQKYSVREVSAR